MTDYHDFTTRDTPKEERDKLGVGGVWINAAKCLKCKDTIRSKNRHDFVTCTCGNISVDGGSWYCKRSVGLEEYEDLSEPYSDVEGIS